MKAQILLNNFYSKYIAILPNEPLDLLMGGFLKNKELESIFIQEHDEHIKKFYKELQILDLVSIEKLKPMDSESHSLSLGFLRYLNDVIKEILDSKSDFTAYPDITEIIEFIKASNKHNTIFALISGCSFTREFCFDINIDNNSKINVSMHLTDYTKLRNDLSEQIKRRSYNVDEEGMDYCKRQLLKVTIPTQFTLEEDNNIIQMIILGLRLQHWRFDEFTFIVGITRRPYPNFDPINDHYDVRSTNYPGYFPNCAIHESKEYVIDSGKFKNDLRNIIYSFKHNGYRNILMRMLYASDKDFAEDSIIYLVSILHKLYSSNVEVTQIMMKMILGDDYHGREHDDILETAFDARNSFSHGSSAKNLKDEESIFILNTRLFILVKNLLSKELHKFSKHNLQEYRKINKDDLRSRF